MNETHAPPRSLDETRIEAFVEQLFGTYVSGMVNLMVDLGHRTGLFDALAEAPATSEQLAQRAGLNERYVREWLGAVATAGIVDYDGVSRAFTLPAEHAACLTGSGSMNLAPLSKMLALLANHVPEMATVFREGGGIPYERFRPEFTEVMDGLSRGVFDEQLVDVIVPMTGLADRLADGIQVADIG
ncbi:MAG: transcriptional regulator, partial [Actinomycetota bacterium]|nr:transcriptional regulator [Actinomycetota bacterium]